MSRTIKFAKAGGPEVLEFVDAEVPAPGPSEVRISVKAIGINRAEAMWRADEYIEPVKFPAGLGYEAAGIVDAVGQDVTRFAPGDKVNLIPSFSMNQYHTYGDPDCQLRRRDVDRDHALDRQETAVARCGRGARHCHGRDRSGRRNHAHHGRPGCARRVRSGRRCELPEADYRAVVPGHCVYLWRA